MALYSFDNNCLFNTELQYNLNLNFICNNTQQHFVLILFLIGIYYDNPVLSITELQLSDIKECNLSLKMCMNKNGSIEINRQEVDYCQ